MLFHAPAPPDALREALQQAVQGDTLEVVDFGGALGSTYHQHRASLTGVSRVRWTVVEQPGFVAVGQREFTTEELHFRPTVDTAAGEMQSPTLLLSGVLAYLDDPYAWIARFRLLPVRRVIVDRTGFVRRGDDRLTVQQVPPEIYPASYPCRFFSRARLLAAFGPEWTIQAEWRGNEDVDLPAEYRGFVLTRPEPR